MCGKGEFFKAKTSDRQLGLDGEEDSVLRETLELRRDLVLLDLGKAVFSSGAHT